MFCCGSPSPRKVISGCKVSKLNFGKETGFVWRDYQSSWFSNQKVVLFSTFFALNRWNMARSTGLIWLVGRWSQVWSSRSRSTDLDTHFSPKMANLSNSAVLLSLTMIAKLSGKKMEKNECESSYEFVDYAIILFVSFGVIVQSYCFWSFSHCWIRFFSVIIPRLTCQRHSALFIIWKSLSSADFLGNSAERPWFLTDSEWQALIFNCFSEIFRSISIARHIILNFSPVYEMKWTIKI